MNMTEASKALICKGCRHLLTEHVYGLGCGMLRTDEAEDFYLTCENQEGDFYDDEEI